MILTSQTRAHARYCEFTLRTECFLLMAINVQSTILVTQLMARFYPPLRLLFSQCNEQPLNEALTSMGTSLGGQPAIILPLTVCYCLPNLTSYEPSYHRIQSYHHTILPSYHFNISPSHYLAHLTILQSCLSCHHHKTNSPIFRNICRC